MPAGRGAGPGVEPYRLLEHRPRIAQLGDVIEGRQPAAEYLCKFGVVPTMQSRMTSAASASSLHLSVPVGGIGTTESGSRR
jgi:hypothetical protein